MPYTLGVCVRGLIIYEVKYGISGEHIHVNIGYRLLIKWRFIHPLRLSAMPVDVKSRNHAFHAF